MSEPDTPSLNSLELVTAVVEDLARAGLNVHVFGGWAEELHGLAEPRPHQDIDLLVIDPDEELLDQYVGMRDEIVLKHLPHKRAFVVDGVMVELLIVRSGSAGAVTSFWGEYPFHWPQIDCPQIAGLPVSSSEALVAYRAGYSELPKGHRDVDYHPHEDSMRVFLHPPSGVLRDDSVVLVTEAESGGGFFLRGYSFADRWFKINLTLDRNGHPAEYGDDGFSFNCDLATPMVQQDGTSWAVDLFLDVLVRADGRTARVCDEDELEDAVERGWVSPSEAQAALRGADELVELAHSGRLLDFLHQHHPLEPPQSAPALPMLRARIDDRLLPNQRPSW